MATIERTIQDALFARAAGIVTSPAAVPISFPDVTFTVPSNGRYLRVFHLPNDPERVLISSGPHRRVGLLQVSVIVPKGQDALAVEIAGQVAEHFPADLQLWRDGLLVKVSGAPRSAPRIEDGPSWAVPVSIPYECFA